MKAFPEVRNPNRSSRPSDKGDIGENRFWMWVGSGTPNPLAVPTDAGVGRGGEILSEDWKVLPNRDLPGGGPP